MFLLSKWSEEISLAAAKRVKYLPEVFSVSRCCRSFAVLSCKISLHNSVSHLNFKYFKALVDLNQNLKACLPSGLLPCVFPIIPYVKLPPQMASPHAVTTSCRCLVSRPRSLVLSPRSVKRYSFCLCTNNEFSI